MVTPVEREICSICPLQRLFVSSAIHILTRNERCDHNILNVPLVCTRAFCFNDTHSSEPVFSRAGRGIETEGPRTKIYVAELSDTEDMQKQEAYISCWITTFLHAGI